MNREGWICIPGWAPSIPPWPPAMSSSLLPPTPPGSCYRKATEILKGDDSANEGGFHIHDSAKTGDSTILSVYILSGRFSF